MIRLFEYTVKQIQVDSVDYSKQRRTHTIENTINSTNASIA